MIRNDFLTAAESAVVLLAEPNVAAGWDDPSALQEFTVGGLSGHLAKQIFVVGDFLVAPPAEEESLSLVEHYSRVSWIDADLDDPVNVSIREGSQAIATAGPQALAERAGTAVKELRKTLPDAPDRRVRQPSWGRYSLRLDDFLTTRLLELVVHSDDLAVSTGVPTPELPGRVTETVIDLLSRVAARRHGPTALLRALSRVERAPGTIAAF